MRVPPPKGDDAPPPEPEPPPPTTDELDRWKEELADLAGEADRDCDER